MLLRFLVLFLNRGRNIHTLLMGLNEITFLHALWNLMVLGRRPTDRMCKVFVLRRGLHRTWLVVWGWTKDSTHHHVQKSYTLENQLHVNFTSYRVTQQHIKLVWNYLTRFPTYTCFLFCSICRKFGSQRYWNLLLLDRVRYTWLLLTHNFFLHEPAFTVKNILHCLTL